MPAPGRAPSEESAKLKRLKKENAKLKQAKEILTECGMQELDYEEHHERKDPQRIPTRPPTSRIHPHTDHRQESHVPDQRQFMQRARER